MEFANERKIFAKWRGISLLSAGRVIQPTALTARHCLITKVTVWTWDKAVHDKDIDVHLFALCFFPLDATKSDDTGPQKITVGTKVVFSTAWKFSDLMFSPLFFCQRETNYSSQESPSCVLVLCPNSVVVTNRAEIFGRCVAAIFFFLSAIIAL